MKLPEIIKTIIVWIILILIMFLPGFAQKYEVPKFKSYVPSGIFVFLAGLSDGARDGFMYRSDGMGQFWNGKNSWLNKYKNRDYHAGIPAYFGSTSFLAFTTDGVHLSNMLTHQFQGMSLAYVPYDSNKKFFHVFLKVAAYNAVREVGHSFIYSCLFKPKK